MLYVEETIDVGEEIRYIARYHWIYTAQAVLYLVTLWWLLGFGIYVFSTRMARKATTHIVITNKRFVVQKGWRHRQVTEVGLERIFGCRVHQDAWGRLLGYGKVTISAAAVGDLRMPKYLNDPITFRMVLMSGYEPHANSADAADSDSDLAGEVAG